MLSGFARFWCGGLVLPLLLLAAAPARGENVRVSVLAILASEKEDKVDRKLECIAREVRKKHKKLKGFRCAQMSCKSLKVGVKDSFDLVAEQVAAITVKHGADRNNRVELKVVPPKMGEITYTTCCGKFFPIVTPFRTQNKELLIIAVRVQPCHGQK